MVTKEQSTGITVLSGDTDVFLFLLYYYLEHDLQMLVTMQSPIKDRVVVNTRKSVDKT